MERRPARNLLSPPGSRAASPGGLKGGGLSSDPLFLSLGLIGSVAALHINVLP